MMLTKPNDFILIRKVRRDDANQYIELINSVFLTLLTNFLMMIKKYAMLPKMMM